MDNAAIARTLGEIADLLEIKGDNPFKIRAYRNAADIVANHPHARAGSPAWTDFRRNGLGRRFEPDHAVALDLAHPPVVQEQLRE